MLEGPGLEHGRGVTELARPAFQGLDDLRRDLAITLLSDTQQGITEIAEALGFAEPSAFHRAFKKWTGARPGEYRCAVGGR